MRASKKVMGAVLLTSSAALVLGAPTVHADSSADNNNGLLGGLNLLNGLQLTAPVTVGGAGVLGVGTADTVVKSENKAAPSGSSNSGGGSSSADNNNGLLGGLNLLNGLQLTAPVTVGGAGVLGVGTAETDVKSENKAAASSNSGGGSSSADNNSGLVGGLNVGNNVQASVPVTVCGVGALLARGTGDCAVASANTGGGGGSSSANGNSGLVGGVNALNNAQLSVPVTVCGLAVLGDADCEATVASGNTAGGSGSSGAGSSSANGNSGLIGGLNLLNNLQVSLPVTVCGLAVLGDADAQCEVTSTNNGGGDDDGDVAGEDRDQGSSVRGATLPHTGAAGLALIPFGAALIAGGVALRRRVGAEA